MRRPFFLLLVFLCLPATADTLSITDGQPGTKYPGKFVWTDLVSSNPASAADFYSDLFGWEISHYSDDYRVIRNNGRLIGGITQNENQDETGNAWISYISTTDLTDSDAAIRASGAQTVLDPITVEERGEFGIYVAPDGAVFGVLESAYGDPEEIGASFGDWIWIELWSKDTAAAATFYEKLGYSVEQNWASDNEADKLLVAGEYARGGIVEAHPNQKQSTWLLYVRVEDVNATVEEAVRLGGKSANLEGEVKSTGPVAIVQDPTGGYVAVYEYEEPVEEKTIEENTATEKVATEGEVE